MNKYQEAIEYFENLTNGCDIDTAYFVGKHLASLKEVLHERPYEEYNEAIDIVCEWIDDEETMPYVEKIKGLLYQIRMRKADADLLNKLRKITNTIGDCDLLNEVERLAYQDATKESDKEIFVATGKETK